MSQRRKIRLVLALFGIAVVGGVPGCSRSGETPDAAHVGGVSSARPGPTLGLGKPPALTPHETVERFRRAGLPVGRSVDYTAQTDPDFRLGKSDDYVARTSWTDTRVDDGSLENPDGAVDFGGSIEMFRTAARAHAEAAAIKRNEDTYDLSTEYYYVVGASLIRVTNELTQAQAAAYHLAALG